MPINNVPGRPPSESMQAVVAERPGPPEVLQIQLVPTPTAMESTVRIKVDICATTFRDTQVRAGVGGPAGFPIILGNGVGGVVEDAPGGPPDLIGAQVVSSTGGTGGYAEQAVVRRSDVHRVPAGVSLATATALLADGRTALGLVRATRAKEGQVALVTAAAGGVGSLLVQLLTAVGVSVIALASTEDKLRVAAQYGARVLVRYDTDGPSWLEQINDHYPGGLDIIFDGVGGEMSHRLAGLSRPGGRYVIQGAASGRMSDLPAQELRQRGLETVELSALGGPSEQFALVEDVLTLASERRIQALVGQTYPLAHAAEAHADMAARSTHGKTLLIP